MTADVDSFKLTKSSKTEILVKKYHCTNLKFPQCDGYLTVTNKRVIFHGLAQKSYWVDIVIEFIKLVLLCIHSSFCRLLGVKHVKKYLMRATESTSRVVTEVDLYTVSGVSSYYGTRTNLFMLVFGVLALIIPFPIYGQFRSHQNLWRSFGMHYPVGIEVLAVAVVILTIVIGLILLAFCRRQVFFLQIFSSQASGAPISIGEGIGNLGGAKVVCALVGNPTKSTDMMMTELGAMISDIKEMGDVAIDLWKPKVPWSK